jgi:mRNA interferase YafQ
MRTIKEVGRFKRDRKRERSGRHGAELKGLLGEVLGFLAADEPLPERYKDHALIGPWKGHRDCHLKGDLVLIYRKVGADYLELVRLGSHSELGL